MDDADPLVVDLSDPNDVRVNMKRAEAILDAKREHLRQREEEVMELLREPQAEVSAWERKVAALEALAAAFAPYDITSESAREEREPRQDGTREPGTQVNVSSMQKLVVDVVNREVRPIQAPTIARILTAEGHDVQVVQVRNALYYAANTAKTILKLQGERGIYAPLTYRDNVIFDSADAEPTNSNREAV